MVVTEEIVKCWMYSDRPITHCLITGTLPKGYGQHPLCKRCAIRIDESYLPFLGSKRNRRTHRSS